MCIVHNLYCGYSLSAYVIISIIMIDQNKTFRSEKSARTGPGLQAPMESVCLSVTGQNRRCVRFAST